MTLKLNGSSSGSVSIDAPASTTGGADVALTLPVNDGDANGQDAISNLKDVTSQTVCEAENIERIEKFYAIFFETIYQ